MSVRLPRSSLALYLIPAIALAIGLRVADLESDPYRRLDWDTGLMTDEGFYTHNARNVALFGHARTDEFNNMLASPLLHLLQTAVFTVSEFSGVNARLISVACSVLALILLFCALRRALGTRVAATAALFFGLDHTNALFNRMALLDTPATLPAVGTLYAFVRATTAQSKRRIAWLAGCGVLLGITVVTRSLCVYLVPAAALALSLSPGSRSDRAKAVGWLLAGLGAVLAVYGAVWYLPHKAEIVHMNQYYRTVQLQPDSAERLWANIRLAFLGDRFGIFPYLFRHTPFVFALALIGIALSIARRTADGGRPESRIVGTFFSLWLICAWLVFAVSSYAPNRYFVTTYPALFAMAAVGLWGLPQYVEYVAAGGRKSRMGLALTAWFLGYHAIESVLHRGGVLSPRATMLALYVAPSIFAALLLVPSRLPVIRLDRRRFTKAIAVPLMIGWAGVNAGWTADWWVHREYTLAESSRWLKQNLPAGSVLLGDVAPGLGMDTPFVTVNVMKGFANDSRPVEEFAPAPRYILTIDGDWTTPYWLERYPQMVDPSRRIRHWRVIRWKIGLYPVPPG